MALHYGAAMTTSPVLLLVEDDRNLRSITAEVLSTAGFEVHSAPDADTARDIWTACGPIDVLITDVILPGKNGPELASELRELQPGLPVLFVSGALRDVQVPAEAVLLQKPFTMDALIEAVRARLAPVQRPRRVLLVDDEAAISLPMARYFRQLGCTTDVACEVEEAAALAIHHRYDVAILDLRLTRWGGGEGLQVVDELRKANRGAAIVILSAYVDEQAEREARNRGADAVVRKPCPLARLARLAFEIRGESVA